MYGTSDRKFIEMEVTIPPTQQPRSKERYINREEEAVLGATEVNSKASRMKDGGEVRGRKGLEEREEGRNRKEKTEKGHATLRISWRLDVAV